jgi:phospholipid/cholesterol/gamma-HCH transport system substrate-binding protein
MQKRAPTLANILVIVLFALSCFGLLLFLWESFGGPVPLKPKGYRFTIAFPRTLALAEQSDVRISGVDVGHVISLAYDKDGRAHVTIEVASKYAPIPSNMHAILRQKTLLGETYVQLKPEGAGASSLPDGGQLPDAQVEPAVTLDDILATFTPETRSAFQVWMQSLAEGLGGQGEEINSSFATLQPFIEDSNKLVTVANSQEGALTASIHNTGVVFDALTAREGQFRGLISNGEITIHAAAQASQAWAEAFRELPAFQRNSETALRSLDSFATDTVPLYNQLRPFEEQLTPLLQAVKPFTPPFNSLLTSLGPLAKAAKTGLPDVKKGLNLTVPLLGALSPVLHNFNPFFQYASEYVPELQALFADGAASTQTHEKNKNIPGGPQQHFLKAMNELTPEGLSVYQQRIGANRANAYPQPGAFRSIPNGLSVFSSSSCANSAPSLNGPESGAITEEILEQLIGLEPGSRKKGAPVENHALYPPVANNPEKTSNAVPAPACTQQGPFTFNGETSQFPHATPSK